MSSDCIAWSARFATLAPACTQHEKTIRKPCAGNPHARFERGIQEPGPARAPRLISTNAGSRRVPPYIPGRAEFRLRLHLVGVDLPRHPVRGPGPAAGAPGRDPFPDRRRTPVLVAPGAPCAAAAEVAAPADRNHRDAPPVRRKLSGH